MVSHWCVLSTVVEQLTSFTRGCHIVFQPGVLIRNLKEIKIVKLSHDKNCSNPTGSTYLEFIYSYISLSHNVELEMVYHNLHNQSYS